jgi:hypothetical protein
VAQQVELVQREWRSVQQQREDVNNEANMVEHEREKLQLIQQQVHEKIQQLKQVQDAILSEQQQQQHSQQPRLTRPESAHGLGFESLEQAIQQFTALEQRTRIRQQRIDNREAAAAKSVLRARDAVNAMADALRSVLQSTVSVGLSPTIVIPDSTSSWHGTDRKAGDGSPRSSVNAGAQKYFEGILRTTSSATTAPNSR